MSQPAVNTLVWQFRNLAPELPQPSLEVRFHPHRLWRFDLCWESLKVAVEIEGGVYVAGRHQRPQGFLGDIEKYNAAVIAGYKLLRFTPQQVESLVAMNTIKILFGVLGVKTK